MENFHYKISNSDKKSIRMKYKDDMRVWKLASNKIDESNVFKITAYKKAHTCS